MSKIDQALYESARIDGASAWQEFRSITVPSLRYEIGVCITITVIASLAAFDIVYISTLGGPGTTTTVPGLEIYRLAFYRRQVGPGLGARGRPRRRSSSSRSCPSSGSRARNQRDRQPQRDLDGPAPAHRAHGRDHRAVREPLHDGASTRRERCRSGIAWPDEPQWGNFLEAFEQAHMGALLISSVLIVLGVVPVAVVFATMAGFAIGHLRIPGSRPLCSSSSCSG